MSTLQEKISNLKMMLETAESEIKSLEGGRKASSCRARKALQNIKQNVHSLRKDITTHVKSLPTKSRVKKAVSLETEIPSKDK